MNFDMGGYGNSGAKVTRCILSGGVVACDIFLIGGLAICD